MSDSKIGSFEAIALIVTVTINHIILNLSKSIIGSTGSSSIINIIFVSLLCLIFVNFSSKILKNFPNLDIIDISDFLGGKFLKIITSLLFLAYAIFIACTLMRSFCEILKIIYFQNYTVIFLLSLFVICIVITLNSKIKSILRANLFILPIVLLSILFICIANIGNFSFERIFPILGNGFSATFFSGTSNLFAFGGLVFLYFIPPYLEDPKKIKKISLISTLISAFYLLLSIATILFMFPFVASSEQVMPLYLVSRCIEFGRFFQRIDAIFLLIWIISIISYLSLVSYFSLSFFKKFTNIKNIKPLSYSFGLLILGLSLIPKDLLQLKFLENTVYKYFSLIFVFGFSSIILILANFKNKKNKKNTLSKGDSDIEKDF